MPQPNTSLTQQILTELGPADQYSNKHDVFVLDGQVIRTPGQAISHCKKRHGLNHMEARLHLSQLVKLAPTA